ncbi:MAG TPA: hypothetical protein VG367_18255 [Mucilaginibacter sp.]|jgi:hypothetical protein|nr:hypothetical protein [Mucilaginibacter sp.]
MTVVVNLHTPEEEKELIAFLEKKHFNYQTTPDYPVLTTEQEKEIIRRDKAFAEGKTGARDWNDIIRDLENVYR